MERDELLDRIHKGEKFLERTDITDEQRSAGEERYCNLVALLGNTPEETEKQSPEAAETYPPEVQNSISEIWRKLDPEGKRRKKA